MSETRPAGPTENAPGVTTAEKRELGCIDSRVNHEACIYCMGYREGCKSEHLLIIAYMEQHTSWPLDDVLEGVKEWDHL